MMYVLVYYNVYFMCLIKYFVYFNYDEKIYD